MQLDADQQVVANHRDGPMLVLAGAGSGKTASIVGRAANLIQAGVMPETILMTTFSKKAASEMRIRLGEIVGDDLGLKAQICTFHSLGDKIIREWPEACGRKESVSILDEPDQRGLFRRLLKEVVGVEKLQGLEYRKWLSAYDRLAQDGGRAVESIHANRFCEVMRTHAGIERNDQLNWLWRVFGAFEKFKAEQNVVDFNDLLVLPMQALARDPEIGKALAMRYQYVTVDEAQDTSIAQYNIVKSFAQHHNRMVVVGDDDQSLYGWRGASVANLKRFIKDFNPQIARLERNYRSTRPIVAAAARHIELNPGRLEKRPYSTREEGGPPVFHTTRNDKEMAHCIVSDIKKARAEGTPWNEMAVLYRKNRIGELLEPLLAEHNVPYEVYGGIKLADRKEVKLALSMARLINNPRDQMAFRALAEGIKGLGEKGMLTFFTEAERNNGGVLREAVNTIKHCGARDETQALFTMLNVLATQSPEQLIPSLIHDWGIDKHFPKDNERQLETRQQRLGLFAEWISGFMAKERERKSDEPPWRSVTRAVIEEPEADLTDNSKVILSTFHRSKGLEWANVYIAGASDGLMPMRNSAGEVADETEERCTSYVGLTRAKDQCALYHCEMINLGYDQLMMLPSPYLAEMGAEEGRQRDDPLPPIIKMKEGGGVDITDLVTQQVFSAPSPRVKEPLEDAVNGPGRWNGHEIPGW